MMMMTMKDKTGETVDFLQTTALL